MTEFVVHVRATSILITPGEEACEKLYPLLNNFIYEDEFSEETHEIGFMIDETTDTLYLHKGCDIEYIRRLLNNVKVIFDPCDPPQQMSFDYEEIIPPRDRDQEDVINFIAGINTQAETINDNQLFIVKEPGFGKCEPYSRKIPTPTKDGFTLMGDLKIGDYVFDKDGNPTKILDIFEQGEKDVYEVTFEDGRVALCGEEHLWYVFKDNEWKTVTLKELIDNGYDNTFIPTNDVVEYDNDNIECSIETIFKIMTGHYLESMDNIMKQYDLLEKILYSLPQYRMRLIQLLSDDTNAIEISPRFHEYIQKILWSLGYVCDIDYDLINFYKSDKLQISKIKLLSKEKCRCIMVDNDKHLYLTEDFIVTHNTYCSSVGSCLYGYKTMIIMHRDQLREQWMNSLYKMTGMSSKYVHKIESSDELYGIATGDIKLDYDVYLMTHATFRAGLKRLGSLSLASNIGKNLRIGLKIIDEAHLEFRDTLLIDFSFNTKRNIYLTATDGRSNKEENSIFKHVFSKTTYYKRSKLLDQNTPNRWVEYTGVSCNSNCPRNIYRYRVAGGRGMSPVTYGKWVIQRDKSLTHFKVCCDLMREIFNNDSTAKVIIFMPLIDLCDELEYHIKRTLNYDETFEFDLNIKTIHSRNSKQMNEINKRADVIITTIGSCGTGTDIPGITDIVSCSPFASRITFKQVFGRIRYCGKQCHYYDIYDTSVPMDQIWFKIRKKAAGPLATGIKMINWVEDDNTDKHDS